LEEQFAGSQVLRHCGRIDGQGASGTEDGFGEKESEAGGETGPVVAGPPFVCVHAGQKVFMVVSEIVERIVVD